MSVLDTPNSVAFAAFGEHFKGTDAVGVPHVIYFVLVIAGMYAWWQQTRVPRHGGPVLEGAAA